MLRDLDKAAVLKQRLRDGACGLGAQLTLTDASIVEIFGRAGFDWVVFDTEHAAHSAVSIRQLLQVATGTALVALVRPVRLDFDEIRRWLDFGAQGILCPFIETADDAALLVSATRYPPEGRRSFGPRRAANYGFDTDAYLERANESLLCLAIIESERGIDNADAILATDGLDGVIIGPMDLSIDLGCFRDFESERYRDAVEAVRLAAEKHGKFMGTAAYSTEHAHACIAERYALLLAGGDDSVLADGASKLVKDLTK